MNMRTSLLAVTAFLICNAALPAQQSDACPGFADAAKAYIAANFASDEEKPANVQQKLIPLTPQVSALQIFVPPEADEKDARPRPYLAFFAGKSQCEFVQQWDGEIAEKSLRPVALNSFSRKPKTMRATNTMPIFRRLL